MIFIWGKKQVLRSLGYVADFCPICRDLRTFQMRRLGLVGHFYYVSFGEGRLIGHIRTCSVCEIDLNGRPEAYREMHKKRLPPAELAAITRPDWQAAHADRLAVEREVANPFGKLAPDVRRVLIREPFDLVAPAVEERFSTSHLDWPTVAAILGLIASLVIAAKVAPSFPGASEYVFAAALAIGLAGVASQLYLVKRRFFRSKVFPVLTLALRPLKPTRAELQAVLQAMKAEGRAIGKKLDANTLVTALQRTGVATEGVLGDAADLRAT